MPARSRPDFRLRLAQPHDLDALHTLENASFTSDLLSRRRLLHWTGADNGIFVVALDRRGALAGYGLAVSRSRSDSARIYSLAIAASARGMGLGTRLLRDLERRCRQAGFKRIHLEVAVDNRAALALYAKLGYAQVRRIAQYYEDGKDAWRMAKALR